MTSLPNIRYIPLVIIALAIALGLWSCKNNTKRIENQAVITDSLGGGSDGNGKGKTGVDSLFQVHTMSAVFYGPDSIQLDSLKATNKDHYNTVLDEVKRNQNQAKEFLKSKNIRIFSTDRIYLQFEHPTGEPYNLNRKELKHLWGLLLYDHDNPPKDVEMNMVEFEYLQYFVK